MIPSMSSYPYKKKYREFSLIKDMCNTKSYTAVQREILLVVFNKGLAPGSLMQVREAINSKFMAYYDEHGITPSKIDVIAYVDIPK